MVRTYFLYSSNASLSVREDGPMSDGPDPYYDPYDFEIDADLTRTASTSTARSTTT